MLLELLEGIKKIGIFMLCASTLLYFHPKKKYEKYSKLLVSIMLLLQIISSIGALFYKDLEEDVTKGILDADEKWEEEWMEIIQNTEKRDSIINGISETQWGKYPYASETEVVTQSDVGVEHKTGEEIRIEKVGWE